MKFKREQITQETVVENLLRWLENSNFSGFNWYTDANIFAQELSSRFNRPIFVVSGIISAFSPMKNWEENKRLASNFIRYGNVSGIYPENLRKAKAILKATNAEQVAQILNGRKQIRFFWNIYKPDELTGVTIDRHALACCFQYDHVEALEDNYSRMTENQYKFFEDCYIVVGDITGILPHKIQAILWEDYRIKRGLKYTINE
jgi:hypothetical protein